MTVAALVLAGGRGERLGHSLPKAFVSVAGAPLLVHALEALAAAPEIDWLLPVVSEDRLDQLKALALESRPSLRGRMAPAVAGGMERQDSMRAGLAALPQGVDLVAVHDAARPLVSAAAVTRVVETARREGAALLAVPACDTIKRVRGDRVIETPPRAECWVAQTPQVFRVELLRKALEKATAEGRIASDDAQLVEWLGVAVHIVAGDVENLKVTHAADLVVAERALAARAALRGGAQTSGQGHLAADCAAPRSTSQPPGSEG